MAKRMGFWRRSVRRLFWPLFSFERQFMGPDTVGNYSRDYSWAANQLGHATLGLATAFLFVWLIDHIADGLAVMGDAWRLMDDASKSSFARLWTSIQALFGSDQAFNIILALAFLTIGLAAVCLIGWRLLQRIGDTKGLGGFREHPWRVIGFGFSRLLLVTGLIAGGYATYLALHQAFSANIKLHVEQFAQASAIAAVTLTLAALSALQSRNPVLTALSWTVLLAAALMALDPEILHYAGGAADPYLTWRQGFTPHDYSNATALGGWLKTATEAANGNAAPMVADMLGVETTFYARQLIFGALAVVFVLGAFIIAIAYLRDLRARIYPLLMVALYLFCLFGPDALATVDPAEGDVQKQLQELQAWRVAAAAFLASLAVWWVKEFGNDLHKVRVHVESAQRQRVENCFPLARNGVSREQDERAPMQEYKDDALADALTDGLFYLCGAAIAAAILHNGFIDPTVTRGAAPWLSPEPSEPLLWRYLPETLAAILFVIVYIWVGYSWTRRNIALDSIRVLEANRFALIESAIDVVTLKGLRPNKNDPEPTVHAVPIDEAGPSDPVAAFDVVSGRPAGRNATPCAAFGALRAFSRNELHVLDGQSARPVRHLIIAGRFGSGRTKLGNAMASETVLCHLPPFGRPPAEKAAEPRNARFFSLRNILDRDVHDRDVFEDGLGKPDMFVINDADPFTMQGLEAFNALKDNPDKRLKVEEGLQLEPTMGPERGWADMRAVRRMILENALKNLMVDPYDQTVWLIDAKVERPVGADEDWEPSLPASVEAYREDLAYSLAARLGPLSTVPRFADVDFRDFEAQEILITVALIARRIESPAPE